MSLEPMDPNLQIAESRKYAATQLVLIPVPDGIFVCTAYGTKREPRRVFSDAQSLWEWLHEEMEIALTRPEPSPTPLSTTPLPSIEIDL